MLADLTIRTLLPADLSTVEAWLLDYVQQHRTWWSRAYGTEPRSSLKDVVAAELADLVSDAEKDGHTVRVLAKTAEPGAAAGIPLGIVVARTQLDRFMGLQVGTLSWIYVAEQARGTGAADHLMATAESWFVEQGATGRMVFVTAKNPKAVRLYVRHGYRIADHRMLKGFPDRNNQLPAKPG